jgi:hypothetical protein
MLFFACIYISNHPWYFLVMKTHTIIIPYLLFTPLASIASSSSVGGQTRGGQQSTSGQRSRSRPATETDYQRLFDDLQGGDADRVQQRLNEALNFNGPIVFDLTRRGPWGGNILHLFAMGNNLRVFQLMGARLTAGQLTGLLNRIDDEGQTVLDRAEINAPEGEELVNFIKNHGGLNASVLSQRGPKRGTNPPPSARLFTATAKAPTAPKIYTFRDIETTQRNRDTLRQVTLGLTTIFIATAIVNFSLIAAVAAVASLATYTLTDRIIQ